MALSTLYTAKSFFRQAVADVQAYRQNSEAYVRRFESINNVQQSIQAQFADIVSEAFMTPTTPVLSTTGKYYSSGASWAASTSRLTATMSANWASTDVGNLVIFRYGSSVYVGTIIERISNTVVKLRGDNLPATDLGTVDDVIMAGTTVDGSSAVDISSLKMLRYASQVKLRLESTATKTVEAMDPASFQKFQVSAANNSTRMAWMLQGNYLYVKFGSGLSSAGTLTLWYPRLPDQVSSDSDNVDLLDGAMVQIGIIALKVSIQRSLGEKANPVDQQELQKMIAMLYQSMGGTIGKEEIKKKVEALV